MSDKDEYEHVPMKVVGKFVPEHGISPQLQNSTTMDKVLEKVEALEKRVAANVEATTVLVGLVKDNINMRIDALDKRVNSITANLFTDYSNRLDEAMRRINELEKHARGECGAPRPPSSGRRIE